MQNDDLLITLAAQSIKDNESFNQFKHNNRAIIKDTAEEELRNLWNAVWVFVMISKRITKT